MIASHQFRLNEPLVASQEIEGETVLIHFDSGHYFCTTPSGSFVIAGLRSGLAVGAVAQSLAAHYERDTAAIAAAVDAFVAELLANALIVPADAPAAPSTVSPLNGTRLPTAFEAPRLERFDDLQDLLMLDPIHDVDQAGWPMAAAPHTPGAGL